MTFSKQRALHRVQQQLALRGYVSKAAAIAGALVHLGQPVSRAASMAEAAMDPADTVNCQHSVSNVQAADTVTDIQVAAASQDKPSGSGPDHLLDPLLKHVDNFSKAAQEAETSVVPAGAAASVFPGAAISAAAAALPEAATTPAGSGSQPEAGGLASQQRFSSNEAVRASLESWLRRARLLDPDTSPHIDPEDVGYAIQAAIQAGLPPPTSQFMNAAISYAQRDAIPREILEQHLQSGHTAAVAAELHLLGEHVRDGVKDAEAASEIERAHCLSPANNVDEMVAQVVRGDAPWQHTASLKYEFEAPSAPRSLQRPSSPTLKASVSQPIPLPPAKPKQQLDHAASSSPPSSRSVHAIAAAAAAAAVPGPGSSRDEAIMLHDKAAHQVAAAALYVAQGQHVPSAAHDVEAAQMAVEAASTSRTPAPMAALHSSDSDPGTLLPEAVQQITKPTSAQDEDSESREYWVGVLRDAAGKPIPKGSKGCNSPNPTPSSSVDNSTGLSPQATVPLTAEKRFQPEGERSLSHNQDDALAATISRAAMRVLHDSCGSQAAQAAVHRATGELVWQAVEAVDLAPVQAANTTLQVGACCHSFQPSQHVDTPTQQQSQPQAVLEFEKEVEARLRRVAEAAVCVEVGTQERAVHEEAGRNAALAAQAVAVGEPIGDAVDEIGELT